MKWDFRSASGFSGMLVYAGLAVLGELCFGDAHVYWLLLLWSYACLLPFGYSWCLLLVLVTLPGVCLFCSWVFSDLLVCLWPCL